MDETALIQAARQGDLDAYNRLVLAYQNRVYSQAYRMLNEPEAAEDATQEAFISGYRSLASFRGGSLRAWFLRIVTNACYDDLRKRQRHPTTPLEPLDADDEEVESPAWLADTSESPEDAVNRAELGRAVQHCLDELPVDFKVIVILVDVQGFGYIEVAQSVGCPVGTVKSRLARARLRMRDCLQGFWELLPAKYRLEGEELQ